MIENIRKVLVVMANSCCTGHEVLDTTPGQPYALRNCSMFAGRRFVGMINVLGPLGSIWVRSLAKLRKEVELEVIVSIDQTWQQQATP